MSLTQCRSTHASQNAISVPKRAPNHRITPRLPLYTVRETLPGNSWHGGCFSEGTNHCKDT
jgi:hypothetical protein